MNEDILAERAAVEAAQKTLTEATERLQARIDADPTFALQVWFADLLAHVDAWPGQQSAELHALITKGKNLLSVD